MDQKNEREVKMPGSTPATGRSGQSNSKNGDTSSSSGASGSMASTGIENGKSTAGHTRGPWSVEAIGVEPGIKAGQWYVATVCDGVDGDLTGVQALANAHLIAESPTMLDVMKTTLGNLKSLKHTAFRGYDTIDEWISAVESSIARAEGR